MCFLFDSRVSTILHPLGHGTHVLLGESNWCQSRGVWTNNAPLWATLCWKTSQLFQFVFTSALQSSLTAGVQSTQIIKQAALYVSEIAKSNMPIQREETWWWKWFWVITSWEECKLSKWGLRENENYIILYCSLVFGFGGDYQREQ